jgi:hypothetical protein
MTSSTLPEPFGPHQLEDLPDLRHRREIAEHAVDAVRHVPDLAMGLRERGDAIL